MKTVYYNYESISLDKREKKLKQDGYIKYRVERPTWKKFAEPNFYLGENEYTIQTISLLASHLPNIDGLLIIENIPIDENISESVFFIVFIQSGNSSNSTEIDEIIAKERDPTIGSSAKVSAIHLNSILKKKGKEKMTPKRHV
jgi:hypothetical protein